MSGRYLSFWAWVPNFMITGATMVMPNGTTPGAPTRARSRSKMYFWVGVNAAPPYSSGQFGATQPFSASFFCQVTRSSLLSLPRALFACLSRISWGQAVSSHSRTSC